MYPELSILVHFFSKVLLIPYGTIYNAWKNQKKKKKQAFLLMKVTKLVFWIRHVSNWAEDKNWTNIRGSEDVLKVSEYLTSFQMVSKCTQ